MNIKAQQSFDDEDILRQTIPKNITEWNIERENVRCSPIKTSSNN